VLRRPAVVTGCLVGALLVPASAAWADGGGGVTVTCQPNDPSPGCVLAAETPGQPGSQVADPTAHPQPGVAGGGACRDWRGNVAPCTDPVFGWMGSDGCYYKVDPTWSPPAWDTADQPPPGQAGAFYDFSCLDNFPGTGGGIVWLPAGATGGATPPPAPSVLGQQATNRLALPTLQIQANPSGEQLVNLPSWVWVSQAAWQPISATAAVPGESVTATAAPTSVTWSFGDGTTLVCHGPGTPYGAGDDPHASSPTCGHTYRTSSAGQPGGAYPVTATVTWSVTWAGGGQGGAFPALTTTATAAFRVGESQAVNTAGSGG
jgi:hypothetical protein